MWYIIFTSQPVFFLLFFKQSFFQTIWSLNRVDIFWQYIFTKFVIQIYYSTINKFCSVLSETNYGSFSFKKLCAETSVRVWLTGCGLWDNGRSPQNCPLRFPESRLDCWHFRELRRLAGHCADAVRSMRTWTGTPIFICSSYVYL